MDKQFSEIITRIDRLFNISRFPISLISKHKHSIYCRPMEDSSFISPALIDFCLKNRNIKNRIANQTPYMHITDDEIMFGIVPLYDDLFIFAGPVSSFSLSLNDISDKYEKFFDAAEFSRITRVFFEAPKADAPVFAGFLAEIYDLFHNISLDAGYILKNNSIFDNNSSRINSDRPSEYKDNSIEIDTFVKFENSIHSAIAAGSQTSMDIIWNNPDDIITTNMNLNIDGVLYMVLSLLTVFRRAALDGGADCVEAFDLSDKTLKQILRCKTSSEYYSVIIRASYRFCKIVSSRTVYGPYTSHVKKCEKYIKMNIGQKITIHTLALLCGLSDRQICRIFSECFHCGITV